MKIRVKESLREAEAGERGLLVYLAENAQDVALISAVFDQTDIGALSIHQRIWVAICELPIDSRGNCIGDVQEILTSRGDQEAATYLSGLTAAALKQPQFCAEALALAVHLVLLAALRRAIEGEAVPVDDYLW